MARYQPNEIGEYKIGSSDRPYTGNIHARTEEIHKLDNISEAIASLNVISPETGELDKEKTNNTRLKYIEDNTRETTSYKKVKYFRHIFTDKNGFINIFFDKSPE